VENAPHKTPPFFFSELPRRGSFLMTVEDNIVILFMLRVLVFYTFAGLLHEDTAYGSE
jgi:hypothetical protein